jgi:hypothetical protein
MSTPYYFRTTDRAAWDELGQLYENDLPITDAAGVPYFHANLLLEGDLRAWAQERYEAAAAAGDTALAGRILQHIADSPEFFVLDDSGLPRSPTSPQRVFWL